MAHQGPIRIQRKRVKGWKMPENTVYVGRPTKWGNPYRLTDYRGQDYANRSWCVDDFRSYVNARDEDVRRTGKSHGEGPTTERIRAELRGKNLACWCPLIDKDGNRVPCHADVLLEIANKSA